MTFIADVLSAVKWSAASRYGEHAIGFVTTAILAHLVSPEAFGLLALAALVTGFLSSIADMGTATTLIQREKITPSLEATVFWVSVVTAIVLAALAFAAAPLVAVFFQEPQVTPVLRVLAAGLLFSGVGAVPTALLSREMAFDRLARAQLTASGLGGVIGVGMALAGFGVWSLVAQYLVRVGTETVGVLWISRFRPKARFDCAQLRSVATFGINLSGFQVTNFITRNIDNLLIGRFLGPTALGYYDIAWRLIEYPKAALAGVVGRVMVPTYSRLQSDDERFGRAYVRVVASIALVSVPLLLGLMVVAGPFLLTFFGPQWEPAVALVAILAPVGLAQTMGATTGSVYIAKGRTDWMFAWSIAAAVGTTVGVVAGLAWGIVGVAVGRLAANALLFPANLGISLWMVGRRLRDFARLVLPVFAAGLAMVVGVVLLRWGLAAAGIDARILELAVSVAVGAVVYLGGIWWFRPPILREVFTALDQAGVSWAGRWVVRLRAAQE